MFLGQKKYGLVLLLAGNIHRVKSANTFAQCRCGFCRAVVRLQHGEI